MNKRRAFSVILFLIGFATLLYPLISRAYYDAYYRELANQMLTEEIGEQAQSDVLHQQHVAYNQTNVSSIEDIDIAEVGFVEEKDVAASTDFTDSDMLGIISIPKIDLTYPIYDGATYENLDRGVARIEGTSYPVGGISTNSVISGHNGWTHTTFFSRIHTLVEGDLIEIQNRNELLTYEVYDFAVIEPNDVAALAIIPGQDILTLLTCTNPAPGTHRYLVFAKRVPNVRESDFVVAEAENTEEVSPNSFSEWSISLKEQIQLIMSRYGIVIVVLGVGLVAMYVIFFREPKE